MMKSFLLGFAFCLPLFSFAGPAVLFEEVEVKDTKDIKESQIVPLSQRTSLRSRYEMQEFDSIFDLRTQRRVGLGAMTSGATGLLGVLIELNLTPMESAVIGFGGGDQYQAFNFQWRHIFGGESFSPYAGIGYARWYNASGGGSVGKTTPSFLESQFLTDAQKRSGRFGIDLLTPTAGIQYSFLNGEYTGLGIFAELVILTEVSKLSSAPTGALGALYYF